MDDTNTKPAPKTPADTVIRWEKTAEDNHNLIRGLSPTPGATAMLRREGKNFRLKILGSAINREITGKIPGTLIVMDKSRLVVACGKDTLEILSLVPEDERGERCGFLRGLRFVRREWPDRRILTEFLPRTAFSALIHQVHLNTATKSDVILL